jgi:hypothetical protein
MQEINEKEVKKIIESVKGQFFSVEFRKRTDGTIRQMNCRVGVTKFLKGGERAYEFEDYGLVGVYDVKSGGYRCFGLESLISIKADGQEFLVKR